MWFSLNVARGAVAALLTLCVTTIAGEAPAVWVRFSLAGEADDSPTTVKVSGKILDARTREPIAGALVRGYVYVQKYSIGPERWSSMPYRETRCDEHGAYELRFVTSLTSSGLGANTDAVRIDAGAEGYETQPQYVRGYVTRDHAELTHVDLELRPGKLVRGKVVDEAGQPLADALVRVQASGNADWKYFNSLGMTKTGADGAFRLWISTDRSLITRDPWLWIVKENYGIGYAWGLLEKDDLGTLTIRRGGTIVGRVLDAQEKPVPKCDVCIFDNGPNRRATAETDEQGRYELRGVPGKRVLKEFYQRRNSEYNPDSALFLQTVYARANPRVKMADAPRYRIMAKEDDTVTAPDLVIGRELSVAGKLLPSKNAFGLSGIRVRLDSDWDDMVAADGEGNFRFANVAAGKHRLTAYLPTNLRGDRGIGQTEVELKPGQPVAGVRLPLEILCEVRVQFVDAAGAPLEGITAGATWNKNGTGFWTEGSVSDRDGRALLYLYPVSTAQAIKHAAVGGTDGAQYVRGFDSGASRLVSEGFREVFPLPGKPLGDVRITMVPPADIEGELGGEGLPAADSKTQLFCRLDYADGVSTRELVTFDPQGKFKISRLPPGVVKLSWGTWPTEAIAAESEPIELKPGRTTAVSRITLKKLPTFQVSGRLKSSPTLGNLEGLLIRLDLLDWQPMVPTDSQGRFVLPKVPSGKHRLTAYLPFNQRTDRGVGHVNIDVQDGDLGDVVLPLENLAVVPVRIVDQSGKPLAGLYAAAWWTENHSGVFTEGLKSDQDGQAMLYLYPDQQQYVGAHDRSGKYRLKGHQVLQLKPGQTSQEVVASMEPVDKN